MKAELTEEIEVIKKRLSEVAGTGKYDTILFHPGTAQLFLSLLTKQEEQPQAIDAEDFYDEHGGFGIHDLWDAFRFAEAFHEAASQPLKQANAELKNALSGVMQVVNEEEEFDPDHVKKWNKILSKHDKQ